MKTSRSKRGVSLDDEMHRAALARAGCGFGGNLSAYIRHLIEKDLNETPTPPSGYALHTVLTELCASLDAPTLDKLTAALTGKNQMFIAINLLRAVVELAENNPEFSDTEIIHINQDAPASRP